MSTRSSKQHSPRLLRGSVITLRRRCGKPQCHCANGEPHQTPALSYSLNGRTQIQTLSPDLLPQVRKALARYRKTLAQLERQAADGIVRLRRAMGHPQLFTKVQGR